MVGPAVKREGVAHLRATMGLSERRACSIVSADRKMVRYRSCRPPDTELRTQLRDLANGRRRFGYRRLFVRCAQRRPVRGRPHLPARSRKGLTVRSDGVAARSRITRANIVEAPANADWSLHFVHDHCLRRTDPRPEHRR